MVAPSSAARPASIGWSPAPAANLRNTSVEASAAATAALNAAVLRIRVPGEGAAPVPGPPISVGRAVAPACQQAPGELGQPDARARRRLEDLERHRQGRVGGREDARVGHDLGLHHRHDDSIH